MNRKITLILAILILAVVSVSIVTAVNDTSDSVAADDDASDSISQDGNVDKVSDDGDDVKPVVDDDMNGGLTVKKVWEDNDNASGKRPSSIKFKIIENNDVIESGCEITESMGWQATLDFAVLADSNYQIVEEDVPDGYTANVTGSAQDGFVITNTNWKVWRTNTTC